VEDVMPSVTRLEKKVLASMSGPGDPILEFGHDVEQIISLFQASLERHSCSSQLNLSKAAVNSTAALAKSLTFQQLVVGLEPSFGRHLDLLARHCIRDFEDQFGSLLAFDDGLGAGGSLGRFDSRARTLKR
jgi:hypothetical protein